jgi:hypothetical protein
MPCAEKSFSPPPPFPSFSGEVKKKSAYEIEKNTINLNK